MAFPKKRPLQCSYLCRHRLGRRRAGHAIEKALARKHLRCGTLMLYDASSPRSRQDSPSSILVPARDRGIITQAPRIDIAPADLNWITILLGPA